MFRKRIMSTLIILLSRTGPRAVLRIIVAAFFLAAAGQGFNALAEPRNNPSGQQLPRFASLKSDQVNVRVGPGKEYPIQWVYRRAGLPVEVIKEYGNWRQIRDSETSTGWVFHALLSRRRTMMVLPWEVDKTNTAGGKVPMTPVFDKASTSGNILVKVEPGVIGSVFKCDRTWCDVSIMNYRGWISQKTIWGVYPPEIIR